MNKDAFFYTVVHIEIQILMDIDIVNVINTDMDLDIKHEAMLWNQLSKSGYEHMDLVMESSVP